MPSYLLNVWLDILYLNFQKLTETDTIKFFGLHFDTKLNWKHHIDQLKAECAKRMKIIKLLSGHQWGADENTLIKIYRALIRSKLDYGSIAYTIAAKTVLKRLETFQNQALRLITGAFRTSPIQSLQLIAKEPPLHIRWKNILINYSNNVLSNQNNINYHKLQNYQHQPNTNLHTTTKLTLKHRFLQAPRLQDKYSYNHTIQTI